MSRRSSRPTAAASTAARATAPPSTAACPCGTGAPYAECCGPFHRGTAEAPTAEKLMRSRYSAFTAGDTAYLLRTWAARTRPQHLDLDPAVRWTGLDVHAVTDGSAFHTEGTVEFTAHFLRAGHRGRQHELSLFARESGRWVYVDAAG